VTKARLEAFSDGVFAIVITLLVIEIRPPHLDPGETLADGLGELWPNYVGYALSFLILGVMWLNHHRIFEPVQQVEACSSSSTSTCCSGPRSSPSRLQS
jgi:uncharacterized membrane protein